MISLVTVTRNRRWAVPIMLDNFSIAEHFVDEWVILDDGFDDLSDCFNHPKIRYIKLTHDEVQREIDTMGGMVDEWYSFHKKVGRLPMGRKRNMVVEKSNGDIIIHLDDDDMYAKESFETRLPLMEKYDCLYCSSILLYDIHSKQMVKMSDTSGGVSEATLMYTRSFWKERGFEDAIVSNEGRDFVNERGQLIESQNMFVSLIHGDNITQKTITGVPCDLGLTYAAEHFHLMFDFFKRRPGSILFLCQDDKIESQAIRLGWDITHDDQKEKELEKKYKKAKLDIVVVDKNYKHLWARVKPKIIIGKFDNHQSFGYIDIKQQGMILWVERGFLLTPLNRPREC